MKTNFKKSLMETAGFTLVELMIVLAILGILAAVSIGMYKSYVNNAKCTEVEVAAHDTILALMRALADSGTAPAAQSDYVNSLTIGGETLTFPTNVKVKFSGSGTQASPFVVNAKRSNPTCGKGDGEYELTQGHIRGAW